MNRKIAVAELNNYAARAVQSHPDRLLSLSECAARTGHKVSTWRAWILRRKVPYYKVGRSVRVSERDILKLLEQSLVPARD
jgi:excisionase family DNA binding protein